MKLIEYLIREELTQRQFADRCGLSPATISLLVRGQNFVSRPTAQRIIAATNGEVTADDFLQAPAE